MDPQQHLWSGEARPAGHDWLGARDAPEPAPRPVELPRLLDARAEDTDPPRPGGALWAER